MATLTVEDIIPLGLEPAAGTAVSSEDTFTDDGLERTFVEVTNGGGSPINVTVPDVTTSVNVPGVGAVTPGDRVIAVTNGERRLIGPFPSAYRTNAGLVTLQFSGTTSVTANVFRLAKVG